MTLQEKHYKVVEDATAGLFDEREDYLSAMEKVAKDSAEITKSYMKDFANWILKLTVDFSVKGVKDTNGYLDKNTGELVEIYLKEIEANGN